MMYRAFCRQINDMLTCPCKGIVLAVSGGVDSMLMAEFFDRCRPAPLAVAHVNFTLRGEESDGDESFVRRWAASHKIPFYCRRFDTLNHAREQGVSVEMAARDLRYRWFEALRQGLQFDYIAIAHNANDQAETVLLNWTRGTGLRGLCGMQPLKGHLLRPMLSFSRARILEYAEKAGIRYREDATNASDAYSRNKIRHHVIPQLEQINPDFLRTLSKNCSYLTHTQNFIDAYCEHLRAACVQEGKDCEMKISKAALGAQPHGEYLLFYLLQPYGFASLQLENIVRSLDVQSGRSFESAGYRLILDRDYLYVLDKKKTLQPPVLKTTLLDKTPDYKPSANPLQACLDADLCTKPLELRLWRAGDRFMPLGMQGFKKVSDFLTDIKLPLHLKQGQYVLCCGRDIVWVAGRRIDERYKVGRETRRVLLVEITSTIL